MHAHCTHSESSFYLHSLMVNQELCLEYRLPFVMMMNEAYLYTEQESLVSVIEFAQNKFVVDSK